MAIRTYGPNAVDWEARIDVDRLRTDRLQRLRQHLDASELGALLTFDFSNIRYMTATHIGTWAMDKLIRFALLPGEGSRSFGTLAQQPSITSSTTRGSTTTGVLAIARFPMPPGPGDPEPAPGSQRFVAHFIQTPASRRRWPGRWRP